MKTALKKNRWVMVFFTVLFFPLRGWADNPIVSHRFTPDPSALVHDGRLYIIPPPTHKSRYRVQFLANGAHSLRQDEVSFRIIEKREGSPKSSHEHRA